MSISPVQQFLENYSQMESSYSEDRKCSAQNQEPMDFQRGLEECQESKQVALLLHQVMGRRMKMVENIE